jgi:hypothetical protein
MSEYSSFFRRRKGEVFINTDFRHHLKNISGPDLKKIISKAFAPRTAVKKKFIPADVRWAVWERDNFTCQHCGVRKNLSVDHVHPESKGGRATVENCQTLCKPCNSRKGAR